MLMTVIVLDPAEKMFSGSADGRIFVNTLDIGLVEEADEPMVLKGHEYGL